MKTVEEQVSERHATDCVKWFPAGMAQHYAAILRAAEWSELNHGAIDGAACTAPELREVADRVLRGELDVSDMPEIELPWCDVVLYLASKGIDVFQAACDREDAAAAHGAPFKH